MAHSITVLTALPCGAGIAKGSKALVLSPGLRIDGFCAKTLRYGPQCNRRLPSYSLPVTRPSTPGLSLVTTVSGLTWAKAPAGAAGAKGPAGALIHCLHEGATMLRLSCCRMRTGPYRMLDASCCWPLCTSHNNLRLMIVER